MEQAFFDGWQVLLRTVVVGPLAYLTLIVFLRVSGKRTLSKMNAFDFVVTVALGSTLATILINKNVSLAQGALALALLIGLQYVITWSTLRVSWLREMVTGEPALLLHQGRLLPQAMRRARITDEELRAGVRSAGLASLEDAEAVVLETDGSLSVVQRNSGASRTSLTGLEMADEK